MVKPNESSEDEPPDPQLEDIFSPWKEFCDDRTKFFSYLRTRRAIRAGNALWDLSKEEIKANHWQEPWAFNLYQSVLSALPATLAIYLLTHMGWETSDHVSMQKAIGPDAIKYFDPIYSSLHSVLLSLSLALAASFAALGSIDRGDRTKERLARARRLYLYYDGAYGMWPQAVVALFWTLSRSFQLRPSLLMVGFGLLALVAAVSQLRLTAAKIPKALFGLNDYDDIDVLLGDRWWRYFLWTGILFTLLIILLGYLILRASTVVAILLAHLVAMVGHAL